MSRYTGPKNKLSRRENIDLFNKGAKLRKLNIPPGVHGPKAKGGKLSEFGQQLREKQKTKRFYGLDEKKFKSYYVKAIAQKGKTGQIMLQLLERRLDNLLVRGGLCPTRAMGRQLVTHGHVLVDGQKVDRPSYQINKGQVVTLDSKAVKIPAVVKLLEIQDLTIPNWIQRKAAACKIISLPEREDISEDFDEQTIVEFYSR